MISTISYLVEFINLQIILTKCNSEDAFFSLIILDTFFSRLKKVAEVLNQVPDWHTQS